MGETRVDLLHLLEDLRDAYPGPLEETILTEIVANALDSGASRVTLTTDPPHATLTVVDDGSGMRRRELARYHDIAASTKTRGEGIGFAGVGIKLGLLACQEVLTETRRGKSHVASSWALASRHRAPWRWVPPPGSVAERGTAVHLRVKNPLSPLVDSGFVEAVLRRHFEPLLDPTFAPLLAARYRHGVTLVVNGAVLEREPRADAEAAPIEVRIGRRRKASALGWLERTAIPLPEDRRGLAVSTLGKVIRGGWDWIGVSPAEPDRIRGLIEVPALAEALTLNKGDFVRTGPRGALYLAHRKAIQEAVSRQLAAWGDVRDRADQARQRAAGPLARDIERVVAALADDFPLLATLVEHRKGAQGRLRLGAGGAAADGRALVLGSVATAREEAGPAEPPSGAAAEEEAAPPRGAAEPPAAALALPARDGQSRPARYGLAIEFEERPDDAELGRLVESTVWVNSAHPAFRRAAASRSEGYHVALAAALSLAPLAVEPSAEHAFVTAFLARWGAALEAGRGRGRSG